MNKYNDELIGVLFKNDEKALGDVAKPDYKGNAMLTGVRYWLSAWVNVDKNNRRYMSLRFTPQQSGPGPKFPTTPAPATPADFNDDIPF